MAAPVLNTQALEHARERVAFLSGRASGLALSLQGLQDEILETHRALRDAAAALRGLHVSADVPILDSSE